MHEKNFFHCDFEIGITNVIKKKKKKKVFPNINTK